MRQTLTGYDVLLIEDNEADARFFGLLLKRYRSRLGPLHLKLVTTLTDGLDQIVNKALDPAVVLLDLSLPDAQGTEGVKALVKARPNLPVIVLTGLADTDTASQALAAGAVNYLTKESVTKANEVLLFWIETTIRLAESALAIHELEAMQAGRLRNLIVACSNCDRWLDKANGVWLKPGKWVEQHGLYLSHAVCNECGHLLYGDILSQMYD